MLKIQSISDIITNSSSEIFCYISSDDQDFVKNLYGDIDDIFGWNQESEISPCVWLSDQNDENFPYGEYGSGEDDYYSGEDGDDYYHRKKKKDDEYIPKLAVVVELPYSSNRFHSFYREGLLGLIKDRYKDKKEDDYNMVLCNGVY